LANLEWNEDISL